jgi:arylsulfatase A-like enzyme
MNPQPIKVPEQRPPQAGQQSTVTTHTLRISPTTILLVAIWIGLTAGFLDLALLIMRIRLFASDFYRLGGHFGWIIPAGVGFLVLVPGAALAGFAIVRRGGLASAWVVGILSLVGFLDVCARLPLELWAALLLSGGLAVQSARLVTRHCASFLMLVHRTTPLLVCTMLAILFAICGGRAYSEYQAVSALPSAPADSQNVLLIVWDTVRTDHLSLHGYGRKTSPNLERLAGRGVRFDQAFATAPWTLPSHSSFFTGRWPHELTSGWLSPLDRTHPTLAEYLAAHGYDTAGFVANLDYCSRETGLSRGFAHYNDYPVELSDVLTRYIALGSRFDLLTPASVINRLVKKYFGDSYDVIPRSKEHAKNAAKVNRSFLDWLSWQRARGRPFFAFLNYNDAHSPYEVPDRSIPAFGLRPVSYVDRVTLKSWDTLDKTKVSQAHVQMAIDVYDDSIFYLDHHLGILLDELSQRGVLDDTLVIVASDHGEHLGDHGLFFHGCSLYRQVVGVPLVIVDPRRVPAEGRVIASPLSLRDLPATIVDLLGLKDNAPFPGHSLVRFWPGKEPAVDLQAEPLLMEAGKPPGLTNQGREPVAKGPMQGLISDGMHYIRSADGLEELYLLSSDPEERSNVAAFSFAAEPLRQVRTRLSAMLKKE